MEVYMPVRSIHDKKGSQHYITVKAPKKVLRHRNLKLHRKRKNEMVCHKYKYNTCIYGILFNLWYKK